MWQLGDKVYLAVASVFRVVGVTVFSLDLDTDTWSHEGSLPAPADTTQEDHFQHVKKLKVFKFMSNNVEQVHLFVVRLVSYLFNVTVHRES